MPFFAITSPSSGNATQLQGKAVAATAPATGTVLTFDGGAWRAAQGVTGPTGPYGADGTKMYGGSGTPSAGLGVSGDYYVDTVGAYLYGPKANGSWGGGISIQGGPTGPQGAASTVTGPTGSTGSQPVVLYGGLNLPYPLSYWDTELRITVSGVNYRVPAKALT